MGEQELEKKIPGSIFFIRPIKKGSKGRGSISGIKMDIKMVKLRQLTRNEY